MKKIVSFLLLLLLSLLVGWSGFALSASLILQKTLLDGNYIMEKAESLGVFALLQQELESRLIHSGPLGGIFAGSLSRTLGKELLREQAENITEAVFLHRELSDDTEAIRDAVKKDSADIIRKLGIPEFLNLDELILQQAEPYLQKYAKAVEQTASGRAEPFYAACEKFAGQSVWLHLAVSVIGGGILLAAGRNTAGRMRLFLPLPFFAAFHIAAAHLIKENIPALQAAFPSPALGCFALSLAAEETVLLLLSALIGTAFSFAVCLMISFLSDIKEKRMK